LFFAQTMIASLRDVGYNNTTSALCEHVDNAIEAGASEVRVYFRQTGKKGDYQTDIAVPPPNQLPEVTVTASRPKPQSASAPAVPIASPFAPSIPSFVRIGGIGALIDLVLNGCGDSPDSPSCKGSNTMSAKDKGDTPSDKSRQSNRARSRSSNGERAVNGFMARKKT
jgi:hypothetical protein